MQRFRRYFPAGPLPDGGAREQALVQFFAVDGGLRTVAVNDLTIIGDYVPSAPKKKKAKG